MITGNYPWRGRSPGGTWGFDTPSQILPGQKTVASLLQEAGYRTAMFGKAGFGGAHARKDGKPDFTRPMTEGPRAWGFDYSYIIPRGHQAMPLFFLENELPTCGAEKMVRGAFPGVKQPPKGKGAGAVVEAGPGTDYYDPDWDSTKLGEMLLAHAEKFLDEVLAKNKASGTAAPFFMHFCSDGAHAPYTPPAALRGTSLRGQTKMTVHTDMVLETDALLGKLVEALEKRGLLANTLICFTSDNGGLPRERDYGHDAVGGLRGAKSQIHEGGTRVPFVVSWPGKVPAGTVREQVVGTFDIVPTALELAGVSIPEGQCQDAVSLVPVLLGQRDDRQPVRKSLLVQSSPGRDAFTSIEGNSPEAKRAQAQAARQNRASDGMAHAIYEGDWKLVIDMKDQAVALYNLRADLPEQKNRIADPGQAERVKQMEKIYREIRASRKASPAGKGSNV
jgi:arylsulfatase A-like enzyme